MPKHDITFTIPQKVVLAKDIEFEVKSDSKKIGTLLISKGNIEWVPANNKINKQRLTWEKFSKVMDGLGSEEKISKRTSVKE